MKTIRLLPYITFILLGCNQLSEYSGDDKAYRSSTADGTISCSPESSVLDLKGSQTGHPRGPAVQRNFHIILEGFKIIPLSGLRSLAKFTPNLGNAMVMGDIIAGQKDLARVEREVAARGLTITDIHKYPARDRTVILFMHVKGFGNEVVLSRNVKALISNLTAAADYDRNDSGTSTLATSLNTVNLDSLLGHRSDRLGEVYQYNIVRANVLNAHGMKEANSANFNTWAAWQGTDKEAVVAGDVVMLPNEVEPVIKTLAENGFELVHNQVVHENPKLFCLHYWAVGSAEDLAKGLRTAFDQQQEKFSQRR